MSDELKTKVVGKAYLIEHLGAVPYQQTRRGSIRYDPECVVHDECAAHAIVEDAGSVTGDGWPIKAGETVPRKRKKELPVVEVTRDSRRNSYFLCTVCGAFYTAEGELSTQEFLESAEVRHGCCKHSVQNVSDPLHLAQAMSGRSLYHCEYCKQDTLLFSFEAKECKRCGGALENRSSNVVFG